MARTEPVVVRVGALSDVVSAIPHLLGFQPAESLVAVSLRGRRMRMAFTMRIDLPMSPESFDDVVERTAKAMTKDGARAVLLAVFTAEPPGDRGMPNADLVDAVEDRLSVPVRDAMLVADGRAWSYRCDDPDCCPPDGTPLDPATPGAVALSAAHAMRGRAILPDRDSVVATVAPVGGIAERSMEEAILRASICRDQVGDLTFRLASRATLVEVCRRYALPPASLTHDEAAQLVVGLHDIVFRDEVVSGYAGDEDEVMRRAFGDLVRLAVPPYDAPACTVLACIAYLRGEGVVAAAALERALVSNPSYGLAQLIECALVGQLHPRELREALAHRQSG
jgi:hypothetical protein